MIEFKVSKAKTLKKARSIYPESVIIWFEHDLEDGWYEADFPNKNSEMSGSYSLFKSLIDIIQNKKVVWIGNQWYMPNYLKEKL